jgi:ribonuclease P protein component
MINTKSIKSPELFQKILNNGTWYGGNFICMYVIANNENANNIGLAIGKKVGKAYKRNHIKRLIKEAYTVLETNLKFGYNIVFVWKSKASYEECTFDEIKNDLIKMFDKAGLVNNEKTIDSND